MAYIHLFLYREYAKIAVRYSDKDILINTLTTVYNNKSNDDQKCHRSNGGNENPRSDQDGDNTTYFNELITTMPGYVISKQLILLYFFSLSSNLV